MKFTGWRSGLPGQLILLVIKFFMFVVNVSNGTIKLYITDICETRFPVRCWEVSDFLLLLVQGFSPGN